MYYGLYMSAAGAHSQSQKLEVLSNNLANVDTVGFKRELALLEARNAEAIERGYISPGSQTIDDIGGGVSMRSTATDFGVGSFKETGVYTDFAIESPDAFFLVQRGKERLLTRAGNFRLDAEGRLLTQNGDQVLTTEQQAIQLDPNLPWRLLPGGIIDQFGDVYELGLVKPLNASSLTKVGDNYFANRGRAVAPVTQEDRRVRNGFLEQSGVNPVEEMVNLIAASRAYETNVRLIQQHDGITSSLIERMLRA
jgi:flagellar basal-body rod protein FlgF